MKRAFFYSIVFAGAGLAFGCGSSAPSGVTCGTTTGDTPTEAYKRVYEAVKSKNTEAIKATLTKASIEFASGVSAKNNTPLEKVFENGFTATTFSATLPEIRDQRINCNMGAVEVWNAKSSLWEDLPFIYEDGTWKLAIGDLFKGSFTSPGKGLAIKEAEAANASRGNLPPPGSNSNTNRVQAVNRPGNTTNTK